MSSNTSKKFRRALPQESFLYEENGIENENVKLLEAQGIRIHDFIDIFQRELRKKSGESLEGHPLKKVFYSYIENGILDWNVKILEAQGICLQIFIKIFQTELRKKSGESLEGHPLKKIFFAQKTEFFSSIMQL